jgi:hypothetical protein
VYRDREVLPFQLFFSKLPVLWNNIHVIIQKTALCNGGHVLGHYQMVNWKCTRSYLWGNKTTRENYWLLCCCDIHHLGKATWRGKITAWLCFVLRFWCFGEDPACVSTYRWEELKLLREFYYHQSLWQLCRGKIALPLSNYSYSKLGGGSGEPLPVEKLRIFGARP